VVGFVLDDSDCNRSKRAATEELFAQLQQGRLEGFVSSVVVAELMETPQEDSRDRLLALVAPLELLPEPDAGDLDLLVGRYMQRRAFPPDKRDDAVHVAYMVLNPQLDVMVSWNCRHLANEFARRRLKSLTLAEGYPYHFEIVTPEEVLVYE
jgi:hypothetical protein